jgi:hypothetical protein
MLAGYLGLVLWSLGDYQQAQHLLSDVFARRSRILGEDTASQIGMVLCSLGEHRHANRLQNDTRSSGIEVRRIILRLLGGVSELGGKPSGPGVEVSVALAGRGAEARRAGRGRGGLRAHDAMTSSQGAARSGVGGPGRDCAGAAYSCGARREGSWPRGVSASLRCGWWICGGPAAMTRKPARLVAGQVA